MKTPHVFKVIGLLSASLSCMTSTATAAGYGLLPKAGTYDASDSSFERQLTIQADGRFTLEVLEKGKAGNLRSGSGEGVLSDAPGGWRFGEGRCTLTLKRAAGGVQLHAETCASAWGDVPFDGKYILQGGGAVAPTSKAAAEKISTSSASPALPSRNELNTQWMNIAVDSAAGKSVLVMAKPVPGYMPDTTLENYSRAAFVIDTTSNYPELSRTEKAKSPIRMIDIPLPAIRVGEGLEFEIDCSYGKSDKVIVINIASLAKGNVMTRKRVSAWMLDSRLQIASIRQFSQVKCPLAQAGY